VQLRAQLTPSAPGQASLREQLGRTSRDSSKSPSSDGPGFKPPNRRKGNSRKRGGQPAGPSRRKPVAAADGARCRSGADHAGGDRSSTAPLGLALLLNQLLHGW
jgi:hypothetical protein